MKDELSIAGEKIMFCPTGREDLPFLQRLWNDGEVMRFVGYPQGLGIDEQGMREWFRRLEEQRGQDREHWIVEAEGEPIGEAYYRVCEEYCGYRAAGMAELDLKLAKEFWGRCYGGDALRTLARYLFHRGFKVLVVSPNLQNKAALRLYKNMGFRPQHRFWAEETGAEHEVWALREES